MKNTLYKFSLLSIIIFFTTTTIAQSKQSKTDKEITNALQIWNQSTKASDLDAVMNLFENSENIMLIGSDNGEIYKGKEQISKWLSMLFKHNSFEWEMKRIDIDSFKNTAWVFVEGFMIVTNDKGNKQTTPYRFSGVLVKHKHDWQWRLFDGSIPRGE